MLARRTSLAIVFGILCLANPAVMGGQTLTVLRSFPRVQQQGITVQSGLNVITPIVIPDSLWSLIQGGDGRLYGAESFEATGNYDSIFRLNQDGTGYRVIFSGTGNAANVAVSPELILQGRDGRLYGCGWDNASYGVVFGMNTDGTGFSILHSFAGATDGIEPGPMVQGSDGRLYGTTYTGGPSGNGTVFSMGTDGSGFTVLRATSGKGADNGPMGIFQGRDGRLYVTFGGSGPGGATVMAMNRDGTGLTTVVAFPLSAFLVSVIQGASGALYAATWDGGPAGDGSIVTVNPDGSGLATLYNFQDGADGEWPNSICQGTDGRLYGVANGGLSSGGVLFALNTDGTRFVTLHSFTGGSDGSEPYVTLFQGSDGRFYGATADGGSGGGGVLYAYALGGTTPVITLNPVSQQIFSGQMVTLTASASGAPSYQWMYNGSPISGATASSYTTGNAGIYTLVATVAGVSVASAPATISYAPQNYFSQNPASITVAQGHSAVFNALMVGTLPSGWVYQWQLNGTLVPNAGGSILLLRDVTQAQAGTYSCVATWDPLLYPLSSLSNPTVVTSAPATLAVVATSDPGRLANLSGRASVGSGGNVLVGGFGVGGTSTKQLLVRGVGPGLASLGMSGAVQTPRLDVFDSDQQLVGTGLAWGSAPAGGSSTAGIVLGTATTPLMNAIGAFSLAAGAADAAMTVAAPPGSITAQLSGAGGSSGIALVEIYDAGPTNLTAHLINLSARATVGTDANLLIGGFVIGGSTADALIIRAVGPGLTDQFGLSGVLALPVLTVFDSNQDAIASNASWDDHSGAIAAATTAVGAFALVPTHGDSVLLVSLPPGAYTAQVSGMNGGTGLALLEIYEVP
jgi:uncharacterized repeat protein (TIGR03803 family)